MWNNVGQKLQSVAKVVCWLGIIGSFFAAILLWSQNNDHQPTILIGLLYLVLGSLASWFGSLAMYGLGLVVEHVESGESLSNQTGYDPSSSAIASLAKEAEERKIMADGGWKCTCGRLNQSYVSTCACGKNKREVLYASKPENANIASTQSNQDGNRDYSVDAFLSENEPATSMAEIWNIWKKYKLNIQYKAVEDYIKRYLDQEETGGTPDNLPEIKKTIEGLLRN